MPTFPHGYWNIKSLRINNEMVSQDDGFRTLSVDGDRFSIQPIGIEFQVKQSVDGKIVMDSCSQIFDAHFSYAFDTLIIELNRPVFNETILIEAKFSGKSALTASV